ncbi:MAG: 50S ribosomal protein L4, partial [Ignavibacteria bacterium]|nr:50S ribosomal protein L4 [Ignavibacteria bacterium]
DYTQKLNKKVVSLARKSALSYKAKANQIIVVEDFNFEAPKTKEFAKILNALQLKGKKTLLLTNGTLENVYKSGRNIERVNILEANKASAYELLNNQILVLQKSAVNLLESTFK